MPEPTTVANRKKDPKASAANGRRSAAMAQQQALRCRLDLGGAAGGGGGIVAAELVEIGAVAIDGGLALGQERFPHHAIGIGDPAFFGFGIAAGRRAFFQHGSARDLQPTIDVGQFRPILDLDTQMLHALGGAFLAGNGEIDAGVLQHPFGIVGLGHARFSAEKRGVKTDRLVQIVDADMHMQPFHAAFLSVSFGVSHDAAGAQLCPPQQFSVR